MLKLRHVALGLVLLLILSGESPGPPQQLPPTGGQQDQTATKQEKAAPAQRGTEQFSLIVQPLPTKKSADETARETRDIKEKGNSDWWIWFLSVLTLAALFGQLIVFIAQAYFLKGTLDATKISADTAQLATQVSKAAIRAVITIRNFRGVRSLSPENTVDGYLIWPNIENTGNSHATGTIFARSTIINVEDTEFLFVPPEDDGQVAVYGTRTTVNPATPSVIPVADAERVWRGEIRILLYCRVNYRDIFNEAHHTEGCFSVGFQSDPTIVGQEDGNEFITYTPWGSQNTVS